MSDEIVVMHPKLALGIVRNWSYQAGFNEGQGYPRADVTDEQRRADDIMDTLLLVFDAQAELHKRMRAVLASNEQPGSEELNAIRASVFAAGDRVRELEYQLQKLIKGETHEQTDDSSEI